MHRSESTITVRIHVITYAAEGIHTFELRPIDAPELPPFTAGAHLEVNLPNGLARQYSLVNSQDERHRYVIGVNRDRASRGGSIYMHDELKVGSLLQIRPPRTNFPLAEEAARSIFVAGGIGITPMWCMIQRLSAMGRPWQLHYAARKRDHAAFLQEIRALAAPGQLIEHFDEEAGGKMLDLEAIVSSAPPDAHLYCCGPGGLLKAFEAATSARSSSTVHLEYFSLAAMGSALPSDTFTVTLKRSGKTFEIPAEQSILDTLLQAGVPCMHSCKEGVCGTCETLVLDGQPDHRDAVLSSEERGANRTMMICVSRCHGDSLTLDL